MLYAAAWSSPLGLIDLASDGNAVTGLWFRGQKYYPGYLDGAEQGDAPPVLIQTRQWLEHYFQGRDPGPTPPLAPTGTPFQREVWDLLAAIPYGETRTYGDLAQDLARRRGLPHMSAQAVGGAVGRNPISLLIPCHRVVGTSGSLTGYAGGIGRKRALLELEGALQQSFLIPDHSTASPS